MLLCILILTFFLIWTFFLTTVTNALSRLGETLTLTLLKKYSARFFYYPFHQAIFRKKQYRILFFSSTLGENLGRIGFASTAVFCLLHLGSEATFSFLLFLAIVFLIVILFFGDFLPQLFAIKSSEKALAVCLPFAAFFLYLTFPISFIFLKFIEYYICKEDKEQPHDPLDEMKETIVQILQSADVQGKLNTADKKLIESVVKFKDRIVREVMVPRVNLFCLPVTTSIREAARLLIQEGYSRTPIYRDTVDNIIGVLMFKDVLEYYMDCVDGKKDSKLLDNSIETVVKGVFYTPETKKVSHLLQEFRTKQMHMAIVVDEYGGTEGVVTIEDILEEIVGDIADEYDEDEETLYTTHPGGGSWIVDARMTILDAEDIFGIHIPQEGEYDTIGGYIFHKVGSIPPKGLKVHHEDFDLEILNSTERSVEKVRITPRKSDQKNSS